MAGLSSFTPTISPLLVNHENNENRESFSDASYLLRSLATAIWTHIAREFHGGKCNLLRLARIRSDRVRHSSPARRLKSPVFAGHGPSFRRTPLIYRYSLNGRRAHRKDAKTMSGDGANSAVAKLSL